MIGEDVWLWAYWARGVIGHNRVVCARRFLAHGGIGHWWEWAFWARGDIGHNRVVCARRFLAHGGIGHWWAWAFATIG